MKKYTIAQIKEYLNGCRLINYLGEDAGSDNVALGLAIRMIDDYEDGIESMLERKTDEKISGKEHHFSYKGHDFLIRKALINRNEECPWEFIYWKLGVTKYMHDPDSYATREDCIEAAKEQIDRDVRATKKITKKKSKK